MKIAIVAGEQSGDELGAALMQALLERDANINFLGVGGDKMSALGLRSLFAQERLAVMGFVEPLKRLPDLVRAKNSVVNACKDERPDLFLGIDSPDFNLRIEKELRAHGITTAHYVSPSVWAWRQGRIKQIRQAVDLMLTLFPFEVAFYQRHDVPAICVGHPLADSLALAEISAADRNSLKHSLNLVDGPVVALMPGSRGGEVRMMGQLFFEVAAVCLKHQPAMQFVLPAANEARFSQLQNLLRTCPVDLQKKIKLLTGQSHQAMQVADVVLLASGTSSLEAMLLKRPMVVAYRMAAFSYTLARYLVKTPYISLPNLLANQELVPEFIQDAASVDNLSASVLSLLDQHKKSALQTHFARLHQTLCLNASQKAADALLELIQR